MFKRIRKQIAFDLLCHLKNKLKDVEPDRTINDQYMKRWHLIPKNRIMNVYYHEIRGSDTDRHLHDHPFFFSSFILDGGYDEHTTSGVESREAGDLNFHSPWKLHKLTMNEKGYACSIFITFFKIRKWGFMTEDGWVPRHKYSSKYGVQSLIEQPVTVETDEEPAYETSRFDRISSTVDGWMRKLANNRT